MFVPDNFPVKDPDQVQITFADFDLKPAEIEPLQSAGICGFARGRTSLAGADLSRVVGSGVEFDEVLFEGAQFVKADLTRVVFRGCSHPKSNFTQALLQDAVFERGDLSAAQFKLAVLKDTEFSQVVLAEADFDQARCQGTRFAQMDLTAVKNLPHSLAGCGFTDCQLTGKDFSRRDLTKADFSKSNLSGASFKEAHLTGARLQDCSLGTSTSAEPISATPILPALTLRARSSWAVI